MIEFGPLRVDSRVVLAPMAGVGDQPCRQLCQTLGTRLAVGEMLSADSRLWHTRKSRQRLQRHRCDGPRWVQIAGSDARMMADAARRQQDDGAEIIDINMGCPAKKVCRKAAGSALLRDEKLVGSILDAVVAAVEVPVTLKIRTGWCPATRNAGRIGRIAEQAGIALLTVHGRTRACRFNGNAEHDSVAELAAQLRIPVIANGDIDTPQRARQVLQATGASAVMIGRAALGRPWLCARIDHFLRCGQLLPPPSLWRIRELLLEHVESVHCFYGEHIGTRVARKHVGWHLAAQGDHEAFRRRFNALSTGIEQLEHISDYFNRMMEHEVMAA